jgi:hypothetical protein
MWSSFPADKESQYKTGGGVYILPSRQRQGAAMWTDNGNYPQFDADKSAAWVLRELPSIRHDHRS